MASAETRAVEEHLGVREILHERLDVVARSPYEFDVCLEELCLQPSSVRNQWFKEQPGLPLKIRDRVDHEAVHVQAQDGAGGKLMFGGFFNPADHVAVP